MNLLVISQGYPSSGNQYAMSYVHTRCLWYVKNGCSVTVLNFSATNSYEYEGIRVLAEDQVDNVDRYDGIISHAPNIKNHVRFLRGVTDKKVIFFFHGHEVLKTVGDYPAPFSWKKPSAIKLMQLVIYDTVKLFFMRHWLARIAKVNKVGMVFVSDWMKRQFERNIGKIAGYNVEGRIIPNSAHDSFIESSYQQNRKKMADFVTIRPLDESKYCIDLVVQFANANPALEFHVYGKGKYFEVNGKPGNLKWFNEFVSQQNIPELLNNYRAALMPTRYDAQGVMVCEMASFGMPVVTSDFSVCVEMLEDFRNVTFLPLTDFGKPFEINRLGFCNKNNNKFSSENLVAKEVAFFNEL